MNSVRMVSGSGWDIVEIRGQMADSKGRTTRRGPHRVAEVARPKAGIQPEN